MSIMNGWKSHRRSRKQARQQQLMDRLAKVETTPAESSDDELVISVALNSKPDPQRPDQSIDDLFEYIRPWWTTVNNVGLHGVILHDGVPEELTAQATTDRVSFVEMPVTDWPIYHDRHRMVRDFLRTSTAKRVFVTDISDVAFKRNPFEFILSDSNRQKLFIGSEPHTIGDAKFMRQEMPVQFGEVRHAERVVVNPGIIGGERENVLALLESVVELIEQYEGKLANTDMSIINEAVHSQFAPEDLVTGHPLHSRFKGWEFDTDAAILHK